MLLVRLQQALPSLPQYSLRPQIRALQEQLTAALTGPSDPAPEPPGWATPAQEPAPVRLPGGPPLPPSPATPAQDPLPVRLPGWRPSPSPSPATPG